VSRGPTAGGNGRANALELDGVHTYRGAAHVLQGISLRVGAGEAVCLVGRNGEDGLAERLLGPTDGFMARVELISAVDAKRLVAIAEGVEEVDRGAASDDSARNRCWSWSSSGCHRPGIPVLASPPHPRGRLVRGDGRSC
jgi:hypothetical protein